MAELESTYECGSIKNVLVFVYGTLRRGASNHNRMAGSLFLATAKVPGRLYLIDWYPGLVLGENLKEIVLGEIYSISPELLQDLDAYEGPEYKRREVVIEFNRRKSSVFIWEYYPSITDKRLIKTGDWLNQDPKKL